MSANQQPVAQEHYTFVIIGSGFGATMTGLSLARAFKERKKGETILMLERGTWWTTPVSAVQDKEVETYGFLRRNHQPVQYWQSQNHFGGFIDLATRCVRWNWNKDGLYEITRLGTQGLWSLFRWGNDGVSITRACGVGGGSLVYSNITLRPPELIFADERWRGVTWDKAQRDEYYDLARQAIGVGVVYALNERVANGKDPNFPSPGKLSGNVSAYVPNSSLTLDSGTGSNIYSLTPGASFPTNLQIGDAVWLKLNESGQVTSVELQAPFRTNTGLSNIVTRSSRLDPKWIKKQDPNNSRGIKQIDLTKSEPNGDHSNFHWLDRARVFQTAVATFADDFGTVDSAINDLPPGDQPYDARGRPTNYCERQGRCNVGCLPGARHTLNKQLMAAAIGKFDGTPAQFKGILNIQALAEVDHIEALPSGGYKIHYTLHKPQDGLKTGEEPGRKTVLADKVIVSAGCFGTNEIMLRSKKTGLPNMSDNTGRGFSTNGDYIAFLEDTKERVSLFRGPVTTSVGHVNTRDPGTKGKDPRFHTIEDQGIPPALGSLVGLAEPLIRSLGKGRHKVLFLLWAIFRWTLRRLRKGILAPFLNYRVRQDLYKTPEELTANTMCVVAQGREAARGQFRLGKNFGDTALRVKRTDGLEHFYDDPVYPAIKDSLKKLAEALKKPGQEAGKFINPFWNRFTGEGGFTTIMTTHPLGGCRMGNNSVLDEQNDVGGVVDEYGRVFDKSKHGQTRPFYEGLYIADASIIPTALGVNPSLTISALSLRIADKIIAEL